MMPLFNRTGRITAISLAVLIFSVGQSLAAGIGQDYDLTFVGAEETINGAIYQQWDGQPTGTGVFGTFVEIGQPGGSIDSADGYNTTVNNVLNNGASDQHNYSITLADLSFTTVNTVDYAVFALDINEDSGFPSSPGEFLSLDDVQIFVGGTENASFDTFTNGTLDHDGILIYQMDGIEDSWLALDYSLNNGSGSGDMLLYIDASLFDNFNSTDVITLYSVFGQQGDVAPPGYNGDFGQSDGFEEWAFQGAVTQVPEPGSAILFGVGILIVNRRLRRR